MNFSFSPSIFCSTPLYITIQKYLILFFLLLIIVSCSTNKTGKDENKTDKIQTLTFPIKPMFVDNGKEEGWGADIRLSITNIDTLNNAVTYKVQSTYNSKSVGLDIEFSDERQDNLTLKSRGTISDNLLITLSQLYKIKLRTRKQFVKSFNVTYIDLHSFAKKKFGTINTSEQTAPKEYKLFFQGRTEKDYAEFYLNINDKEHWLELREKDLEYRSLLINFLTKQ